MFRVLDVFACIWLCSACRFLLFGRGDGPIFLSLVLLHILIWVLSYCGPKIKSIGLVLLWVSGREFGFFGLDLKAGVIGSVSLRS